MGVAISIIVGQIGRVTGLSIKSDGLVAPIVELARNLGSVHLPSLLLAGGMFLVLQLARQWKLAVPGPVIVVVLSVVLSSVLGFDGLGIKTVGDLPSGLPTLHLPWISGLPLVDLILGSAAVFVVSFGAGIITARSFGARTGEQVNANAELTGFGAANIASGFFGGFPVTSSDSRTAVNLSVGGRSQIAGLTAAAVLGLTMLFFSDLMRLLPVPALGAILISAALSVIDFSGLRQVWTISRVEFVFAMIALIGAIGFGVLQGVVVAILATFVYITLNAMQPRVVLLGRISGRLGFYKLHRSPETRAIDGMVICFVQGSVLFINADHVKARLDEIIDASLPKMRWLVIDASAISQIDTTGTEMLLEVRDRLERLNIVLAFAETQHDTMALLQRAGLSASNPSTPFFDEVEDAYRAFRIANPDLQEEAEGTGPSTPPGIRTENMR
jgi:MFS superfamily sulfate permease-like transporter